MFKYFIFSFIPAMIPSSILAFIFFMTYFLHIMETFPAVFSAIIAGLLAPFLNPMTYILAFLFGITSYKIKKVWKRLVIQVIVFSAGYTLIPTINFIISGDILNEILDLLYIFLGVMAICLVISLISLGIEKIYFKFFNKRNKGNKNKSNFIYNGIKNLRGINK